MSGIIDDILDNVNDYLGLRDELGAIKHHIYILTRRWSQEKGKGIPLDDKVQILPTPQIVDLSHSIKLREGGAVKQGDLIVKMISKKSYPNESDVNCSVDDSKTMERWYLINGCTYEVVSVTQDYVWWNVQLRKTIKNKYDGN